MQGKSEIVLKQLLLREQYLNSQNKSAHHIKLSDDQCLEFWEFTQTIFGKLDAQHLLSIYDKI